MIKISKTQIDKLGERLKSGVLSDSDIRALDEYRRSFTESYETVVRTIRDNTKLEPTGWPAKSTSSIKEKLLRESIRLTQIQDIAGCRIVVTDILEQEKVIKSLFDVFPNESLLIVDRREHPSHGYRAVHVVIRIHDKLIEVQIRSTLQHLWAELSEKLSDLIDPKLKYGGGKKELQELLSELSKLVASYEEGEIRISGLLAHKVDEEIMKDIQALRQEVLGFKTNIVNLINEIASSTQDIREI